MPSKIWNLGPHRLVIVPAIFLLFHALSFGADSQLPDREVLHAFETGRSFVCVKILSVKAEEERDPRVKRKITSYAYTAKIYKLLVPGDLVPSDIEKPVDLYTGASYGAALSVGSDYALFVTKDTPYFFCWAHRDDVVALRPDDAEQMRQLEADATRLYAQTKIKRFRELKAPAVVTLPPLPDGLKAACADFRTRPDGRRASVKRIMESDLGSRPEDTQYFVSSNGPTYLPPKLRLIRAQILSLLGKPTIVLGFSYYWFCGREANGRAVVLVAEFDEKGIVRTMACDQYTSYHWLDDKWTPPGETSAASGFAPDAKPRTPAR